MSATIQVDRHNQNQEKISTHAERRVAKIKASPNKQYTFNVTFTFP